MAREVTVNLGGEERRLMYDAARAAIEIEKRLGKAPTKVHDDDLRPGVHQGAFSTVSLVFLLWLGLRHESKGLKEETVTDWVSAAFKENEGRLLCGLVRDAIALSGVCGFTFDCMAEPVEKPKEGDGDSGKATAVKAAE